MTNPQDTQPVKIFQNTYQLPSLAGGQMQSIQTKIQNRQSLIQSGQKVVEVIVQEPVETSSGFLGFGKRVEMRGVPQRTTQPLTPEERFHALESQIQDYDRLMALLKEHKTAYQQFLGNLCDEVQQIIHQKFQQTKKFIIHTKTNIHSLIQSTKKIKTRILVPLQSRASFLTITNWMHYFDKCVDASTISTYSKDTTKLVS